jgi:hypothetical protein
VGDRVQRIGKLVEKLKELAGMPAAVGLAGGGGLQFATSSIGGGADPAASGGGFEEAMRRVLGLGAGNQVSAATPAPAAGGPAAAGAAAAQAAANVTKNTTINVTANGLTFAQFEQKVGEIVEAKMAEQD